MNPLFFTESLKFVSLKLSSSEKLLQNVFIYQFNRGCLQKAGSHEVVTVGNWLSTKLLATFFNCEPCLAVVADSYTVVSFEDSKFWRLL
jgi:hypothetical protein